MWTPLESFCFLNGDRRQGNSFHPLLQALHRPEPERFGAPHGVQGKQQRFLTG